MNRKLQKHALGGLLLALCLVVATPPRPAEAQQQKVVVRKTANDSTRVDAKTATVVVEDGKVYVDGKLVEGAPADAHGVRVIRIEDDGGEKEMIIRVAPDGHGAFRGRTAGAPGERRIVKRRLAPGHGAAGDFDLDVDLEGPGDVLRWRMRDGKHGASPEAPRRMMMRAHLEGNIEVARMEREAHELALKAREATGAERTRLEQALRTHLGKTFEKKMEVRREHVERMERELDEVRAQLSAREKARADMIDRRLKELLGKEDVLEW